MATSILQQCAGFKTSRQDGKIVARSWPKHGKMIARSWHDLAKILQELAGFRQDHGKSVA